MGIAKDYDTAELGVYSSIITAKGGKRKSLISSYLNYLLAYAGILLSSEICSSPPFLALRLAVEPRLDGDVM